ncbi:peptidoglycan DD-metalloendopeptidase family protein [Microbacterium sp. MRS-1]|uniref:peptidoglycan DD-metalloendopeptidase family protein n=1 Tax=Microbacterium sp. MRS-1 TaxID=1451261 RepID=UPI001E4099BB|nr:peptidoglycan DD-metalloendopeptidase family protein [Microbacterium sp. MRS-1]
MNANRRRRMVKRVIRTAGAVLALTVAVAFSASGAAGVDGHELRPARASADAGSARWSWPVSPPRITVAYRAPAHAYGPGHRGIDLASAVDADVRAPDDGVVAFAGVVVDRPLITIDHGGGLVSTMEPVRATVPVGTSVQRGEQVGTVATGGHTTPGEIHLGARRDDVYLNPLRLLGEVPRAVLLPCCEPAQQPG